MCSRLCFKCSKSSVSHSQQEMPTSGLCHMTHRISYIFLIITGQLVVLGCLRPVLTLLSHAMEKVDCRDCSRKKN